MNNLLALQALEEKKIYGDSALEAPLDSCVFNSCNSPTPIA